MQHKAKINNIINPVNLLKQINVIIKHILNIHIRHNVHSVLGMRL